ncbi:MAG: hypothetical protein IIX44_06650 [Clostridia bacterium]|nr:hypothetical protein [Clostridia bacterium]
MIIDARYSEKLSEIQNQPSPAGKGDRRTPVDEEIGVCTAEKTGAQKLFCKLQLINARCLEKLNKIINKPSPCGRICKQMCGARSVTDEEIAVCTAETTEADIIQ